MLSADQAPISEDNGTKVSWWRKFRLSTSRLNLLTRLGLIDPLSRYWIVYSLVLVLAVVSFCLFAFVWTDPRTFGHGINVSLFQAAIVALIIAFAVEPKIRRKFLSNIAPEFVWGVTNPDAPAEYRETISEILSASRYVRNVTWELEFNWTDDTKSTLAIDFVLVSLNCNLDPKGFKPSGYAGLLGSVEGFNSEFKCWELSVGEKHYRIRHAELQKYIVVIRDGMLVCINQDKITEDYRILIPKADYSMRREASMYRYSKDYVPLINTLTTLKQTIVLTGSAVGDLEFQMLHRNLPEEKEYKTDIDRIDIHIENPSFPHQMTVLSWKPKE